MRTRYHSFFNPYVHRDPLRSGALRRIDVLTCLLAAASVLATFCFFLSAEARAQEDDTNYFFSNAKVTAELGEKIDLSDAASGGDPGLCTDDRYSTRTDEVEDVSGNNYAYQGGQIVVRRRPVGAQEWQTVKSATITREMIEPDCSGDPSDEDGPGQVRIDPSEDENYDPDAWETAVPDARTEFDSYIASPSGRTVSSKPSVLVPEYKMSLTVWCPGQGGCPDMIRKRVGLPASYLKKGKAGAYFEGDRRLAGLKVSVFIGSAGYGELASSYRRVVTSTFKLRGKKATAILRWSIPQSLRRKWNGWRCVDYAAKVPQLGPGRPCPRSTVTGSEAQASFWLSPL